MASAIDIVTEMITKFPYDKTCKASKFIDFYWKIYQRDYPSNNSVNGSIFEQLLVLSLIRENISPVYVQAKLAFVPNVILDIVLYNRKSPVTISAKTTLRERWKQADLEAMATKYVHRDAKCFVVTLSEKEVAMRRKEENSYMGIDRFVLANTEEFDELIDELKLVNFRESESIEIIQTSHKFYTSDKIEEQYGFKIV